MDLIDPALLDARAFDNSYAGIAFNDQRTLFATVNTERKNAYIRSTLPDSTELHLGSSGPPEERLVCPSRICFVKDTVLITDSGASCIFEFTVTGVFVRSIPASGAVAGRWTSRTRMTNSLHTKKTPKLQQQNMGGESSTHFHVPEKVHAQLTRHLKGAWCAKWF